MRKWTDSSIVRPVKTSFYQYSYQDLELLCSQNDLPLSSASLLFNWYYKKNQREVCNLYHLSKKAKNFINEKFNFELPVIDSVKESTDKTVKFLFELKDNSKIETVLIPFQNKYTVCLSSQVGCAMNCAFCFTGKQGFTRHLTTEEIVGQFLFR